MAQKSRSKELWHIPKRVNLHQSIVFVEAIEDRGYDGQSWSESKQNNLGVNLKNKGATRDGKNISSQAIRTLLASLPQYLGFVYIDNTGNSNIIKETEAGKLLVRTHRHEIKKISKLDRTSTGKIIQSNVARDQLLKLQLTNPIVLKDCTNIFVFPFRFLLKLLLKTTYLDIEEIAYILFQTKDESDLSLKISEINSFRNLPLKTRKAIIDNYKDTAFGNITLVQAPTAQYFISMCEISGLVEHFYLTPVNCTSKLIALKIKEDKIKEVETIFIPKFNSVQTYNFGNNLKLWIEYYGDPTKISTPYDADIDNKTATEVFCIVKSGPNIVLSDTLKAGDTLSFPAFINEDYTIVLYSLISGNAINRFIFKPSSYGDYFEIKKIGATPTPVPNLAKLISDTTIFSNTGKFPIDFETKLRVLKTITGIDYNDPMRRGAYLEYNFFRILEILKNMKVIDDVIWNGRLGAYSLPTSAPGGKIGTPDIIFEIDKEYFVLELTTIRAKAAQFKDEGASVPDHIRLFAGTTGKNVNGIFSAPIIHTRVENAMKSVLNSYGIHLKCITVNDLLNLLGTKDRKLIKSELKK